MSSTDQHREFGTDETCRSAAANRLKISQPPNDLTGVPVGTGEQDIHRGADAGRAEARLLLAKQDWQRLQPAILLRLRHLTGRPRRRSSWALRVLETVSLREPDIAHQGHRRVEIGVGLSRVSNDEIRRQRK